ncbi:MAG TPA: serine/threonine protein kinase [Eggerthellaceae bacterium]|nr:serine/threonine protein kinase [Eggerthellaceae bacterium]
MKLPWRKHRSEYADDYDYYEDTDPYQDMARYGDETSALSRRGRSDANSVNGDQDYDFFQAAAGYDTAAGYEAVSNANEDLLLDRYVVLDEAGSGAFGSVVLAWDTRIQRRVAIKCMPLEDNESLPSQGASILVDERPFDTSRVAGLDEARTAAMLSDASIVSVYDFEVSNNMAYLILEYVDGMALADLLAQYPDEINADIVAYVFKTVAHALTVAHKHHVLHLDIKPENVLIDRQGQVKVTDFGLARLATESGYGIATGGTIGYMPPEQMTGQELDERCDQWALASLTYEMISGGNPFIVDKLRDAEDAIYDAELVIPSLCMDGLDADIDDILFCALDPDPQERYDSVKDFAEQLQPCLGSTRKGKNALKRLVGTPEIEDDLDGTTEGFEYDEDHDGFIDDTREPFYSELWYMSPRMCSFGLRTWAVAAVIILIVLGVNALIGVGAWLNQPIVWGVLLACVVVTAVLPHAGALIAGEGFGVVMCACGAPLPGIVLMAATVPWWFYCARFSVEGTDVGLASVIFGAVGLGPLTPFVAGFLLPVRDAIISTLYAALVAVLFAGLGSGSLLNWNMLAYIGTSVGSGFIDTLLQVITQPSTWITILAWVLASVVVSLLCGTGKKVWGVLGMLAAGALLIAGLIAGSLLDTLGEQLLADPMFLAPTLGALAIGTFLASVAIPARTQEDYFEE